MRTIGVLMLTALLAGCSDDDGSGPTGDCTPSATQVCMTGLTFDPATLTLAAGGSVTWANEDNTTHNTTSTPGNPAGCPSWGETVGLGGTSDPVQFSTGGISCQYFCSIHATATTGTMRGTITVQ